MKRLFLLIAFLVCGSIARAQAPGLAAGGAIGVGQYAVRGPNGTLVGSQGPGVPNTNGIILGCGVTYSGTGLVYDVAACTYGISGQRFTSVLTQVTLTAADATNPRIDSIIVDDS